MSWSEYHRKSEILAVQAEVAKLRGHLDEAVRLYRIAAEHESRAIGEIDPSKARTLGITAVSAAALWYKAHDLDQAERLAYQWLTSPLPAFAMEQLRDLVQRIWTQRAAEHAGVKLAGEGILISLSGGQVVPGGAPLDLVATKVDEVRALVYRTVELLAGLPHRLRGSPSPEVQENCRPWLFQAAPASYQFAVMLQEPAQGKLFKERSIDGVDVTTKLLEVIRAAVEDPSVLLAQVVPEPEYRSTFLKLTRNLAPTGETFRKLEVRRASAPHGAPIVIFPDSRKEITQTLKREKGPASVEEEEIEIRGALRAVHLDDDWLQIDIHPQSRIRIDGAGEVVDDVIGPMVNRQVVVEATRTKKGKYLFRDIQLVE